MNIIEDSFKGLYPEKEINYDCRIKYSGRFKGFNSNIKLRGNNLTINLSKQWKKVSREIRIGLIQSLMLKMFKDNKKTQNIDLYNIFLKNVHLSIPKTKTNALLEEAFNRVNEKYFFGLIEKPNLVIGSSSFSRLGSYDYGTDTVTISKLVVDKAQNILDYIMYHEMLHKKHKFYNKGGKTFHHTREFRQKEREFEDASVIESQLKELGRKRISFFERFLRNI